MGDARKEFAKYKRALLKDNGIEFLICARCGRFKKSIHLHHITELVYGGKNEAENLIPLCGDCHHEWDYYDGIIPFEEFLETPTTVQSAIVYGSGYQINPSVLKLCKIASLIHYSIEWNSDVIDGGASRLLYYEEMERQNKIFSRYDYCSKKLKLPELQEA